MLHGKDSFVLHNKSCYHLLIYMSFQTLQDFIGYTNEGVFNILLKFHPAKISLIQKVLKSIVKVTSELGLFSHVNQVQLCCC